VLSGAIRVQVDDGPAKVYKVGEGVYEEPGSHHRISENASDRDPSKSAASQKICAEPDIPRARTPSRVRIEDGGRQRRGDLHTLVEAIGPGSPWCKSYIPSSPQARYEALGNVLRIFPIAWQFRREHAIF
jgi:hypothetical protein